MFGNIQITEWAVYLYYFAFDSCIDFQALTPFFCFSQSSQTLARSSFFLETTLARSSADVGFVVLYLGPRLGRSNESTSTCHSSRTGTSISKSRRRSVRNSNFRRSPCPSKISSRSPAAPLPPAPLVVAPSREASASSTSPATGRAPYGELGMAVLLRSSASATTAGPSSALLATTFRRGRLLPRVSPLRRAFAARASAEPLEVCAKESLTVPGRLGDCERSLLLLCPLSSMCPLKCKDSESVM